MKIKAIELDSGVENERKEEIFVYISRERRRWKKTYIHATRPSLV